VVQEGRPWSFDGDGSLLRLVSEADRIRLAHLFDPYVVIHTSHIEPRDVGNQNLGHDIESRRPGSALRFGMRRARL
jgi:hypothetical protein